MRPGCKLLPYKNNITELGQSLYRQVLPFGGHLGNALRQLLQTKKTRREPKLHFQWSRGIKTSGIESAVNSDEKSF